MKIITEKLNKLDLIGIDNNNYHDLRNLYEAVEPRMTPQDKQELRKLIDVTDNPETISAYLKSKDEDLNEDTEDIYEPSIYENMATEVNKYLQDNEIHPEDVFETSNGFTVEIEGDWKHDHMKTDMLLNSYFNDNNIIATIDIVPIDDDGSDFYIIVTQESFGQIQVDLSTLLEVGDNENYPWAVRFDDLEVFILTLLASKRKPDSFIDFLIMREFLHGHVICSDECEICGGFLSGILTQEIAEKEDVIATTYDLSEIFDKQYQKGMGFNKERHWKEKHDGKTVFW